MYSIAVLEEIGGKVMGEIERKLGGLPGLERDGFLFTRSENVKVFQGSYDLVAVTAEMAEKAWLKDMTCRILLAPGRYAGRMAGEVGARCVVSYGMSPKDTVTLSSIKDDEAVLAVQREIVTLRGNVLERQEIPVHCTHRASYDRTMAVYGCLLLLGAAPEKLE